MTDYAIVLSVFYVNEQWAIDNNDYATLQWMSNSPKPTQAELDAQWPQADYINQCNAIQLARRIAYETESDGLFYQWQRGDATEAQWREAVAKVKLQHPYPQTPQ